MQVVEDVHSFDLTRPGTLPPYTNSDAYPPFETVDEPLSVQVVDGDETVLVDTGYAGAVHELVDHLNQFGGPDVILVTHGHADHYDGLRVLDEVYDATVAVPEADAHRLVEDVDVVPDVEFTPGYADWGVETIPTPGHTPGHVAVLHEPSGTLIAADSVVNSDSFLAAPGPWDGKLAPCISPPVTDYDQQCASIAALGEYAFDRILLTHGRDVTENAAAQLDLLVEQLDLPSTGAGAGTGDTSG